MTTIKIEMTEQDVCEALADYVSRQKPWISQGRIIDPLDVKLEVEKTFYDRQPGMDGEPVFKKAIITIKNSE